MWSIWGGRLVGVGVGGEGQRAAGPERWSFTDGGVCKQKVASSDYSSPLSKSETRTSASSVHWGSFHVVKLMALQKNRANERQKPSPGGSRTPRRAAGASLDTSGGSDVMLLWAAAPVLTLSAESRTKRRQVTVWEQPVGVEADGGERYCFSAPNCRQRQHLHHRGVA